MRKRVFVAVLAGVTMAGAGLSLGIFVPGGGASSKAAATAHSTVTTRVTVTATDSKFTLSKRSVPTGTVIFTVTNKGKLSHDFKIAGKKTPLLSPGHSATLRVTFSKTGRYPYLSTVSGQASHGMKGVFSVVAAPPRPPGARSHPHNHSVYPRRPGRSVRPTRPSPSACSAASTRLFALSDDDPIGHGHVRDHEQLRRSVQLRPPGHQGGRDTRPGPVGDVDGRPAPGIYRYHCDIDPRMKGSFTVTP